LAGRPVDYHHAGKGHGANSKIYSPGVCKKRGSLASKHNPPHTLGRDYAPIGRLLTMSVACAAKSRIWSKLIGYTLHSPSLPMTSSASAGHGERRIM
jgi:hypothetical protein